MVRTGFESKIIKSISVNIAKNNSINSLKIEKSFESILKSYRGKNDFDEIKYINSLKSNIFFYKYNIRNTEHLLSQWIKDKKIPSKNIRDKEIKFILDKSKEYAKNANKSGGKDLNDIDKKNISIYKNIDQNELIHRLEKEYKVLNVYSDVLNIFMHHIEGVDLEVINYDHVGDVMNFIREELRRSTNYIVKSLDDLYKANIEDESNCIKLYEGHKYDDIFEGIDWESDEEFSYLGDKTVSENLYSLQERDYLECAENISYDKLRENMENIYKECCEIEEIEYRQGFKFSSESIKEYISAIILLELVSSKEQMYLKNAIKLAIVGEIGDKNFADFIKYIIIEHIHIRKEVYNQLLNKIEEKYILYLSDDFSSNQIKDSKYIDFDDYFFIIVNSDYREKFTKNNVDINLQNKIENKCIIKEKIKKLLKINVLSL